MVAKLSTFFALVTAVTASGPTLETDISKISRSWGQISTYADNPANYFGVQNVGLPDSCQIEQVHLLQRHAQRFPTGKEVNLPNFILYF
jgi:hypothetical protein